MKWITEGLLLRLTVSWNKLMDGRGREEGHFESGEGTMQMSMACSRLNLTAGILE